MDKTYYTQGYGDLKNFVTTGKKRITLYKKKETAQKDLCDYQVLLEVTVKVVDDVQD